MSIRFDSETRVFALETAHTSYHMKVDALGHLLHLYYLSLIHISEPTRP